MSTDTLPKFRKSKPASKKTSPREPVSTPVAPIVRSYRGLTDYGHMYVAVSEGIEFAFWYASDHRTLVRFDCRPPSIAST